MTQPRLGVRGQQHLGDFDKVLDRAAVGSAGNEDHVRPQLADALDFLVVLAAVVDGDNVDDDGSGAQRGPLRALRAHCLDHARDRHLQAAARARCRQVDIHPGLCHLSRAALSGLFSSMIFLPDSSSTSETAFRTPTVTSSKGASTVVGASPLTDRRYSPSTFSIRIALVVVLPQSVARIVFISANPHHHSVERTTASTHCV